MKFKKITTLRAKGQQLGHNIQLANKVLRKGVILNKSLIELLVKSDISEVYTFKKNKDDIDENVAAKRIATHISSKDLYIDIPNNGRADIYARKGGMLIINKKALIKVNVKFSNLAICSLKSYSIIQKGQLVGNVKVLPYAISKKEIKKLISNISNSSMFSFKRVNVKKVGLIVSKENTEQKKLKIVNSLESRLNAFNLKINIVREASHKVEDLTNEIKKILHKNSIDLLLIYGSTSIADKNDVIPYSIKQLKGKIVSFGLPTDPGNLALIANIDKTKIIGVPGCASSPKRNGFDIILERLCYGIKIDMNIIAEISEGGLFKSLIKKNIS